MNVFNYLLTTNNPVIYDKSSENNPIHAPASNILNSNRSQIWTSEQGLPQYITLDLRFLKKKPKQIKYIAFDLWHDYDSNPKIIEIQIKTHGIRQQDDFITWRTLNLQHRAGIQYFTLDPISPRYNLMKILIKQTYGASKTYLNQVMLFSQNPIILPIQKQIDTINIKKMEKENWKSSRHEHSIKQSQVHSLDEAEYLQLNENNRYNKSIKVENSQLDNLLKNLQKMSNRIEKIENEQSRFEIEMNKRLQQYIDKRVQQRLNMRQRKNENLLRLYNELSQKLRIRDEKLKRLKNKNRV